MSDGHSPQRSFLAGVLGLLASTLSKRGEGPMVQPVLGRVGQSRFAANPGRAARATKRRRVQAAMAKRSRRINRATARRQRKAARASHRRSGWAR